MSNKFGYRLWFAVSVVVGSVLLVATPQATVPVQAQTNEGEPACIRCHEDLYYLHDTGKWFCIAQSPMQCVGCHGGDPAAITKEAAHQHRTAHPVINGDTTTCRQCHVADCAERVSAFDAIAGISPVVLVSAPLQPAPPSISVTPLPQAAAEVTPVWDGPVMLMIVILVLGLSVIWWHRAHSN